MAGIACLLFAGEFYKFSDLERKAVADVVVDEANGKVPVLVGISHSGTLPSIELGKDAKDVGADGVIVAPPYHSNFITESHLSLSKHYSELAHHVDLPIMIQDYEVRGGVHLSPPEINSIATSANNILYVKVEGDNQLKRIKEIIHLTRGRIGVFGGMAGYYLLQEMRLGVQGSIPGAEIVGPIVEVFTAEEKGEARAARKRFKDIKPYLDFLIGHFASFVEVEKEVLKHNGVIRSSAVRSPAVPLDNRARKLLLRLLSQMKSKGG